MTTGNADSEEHGMKLDASERRNQILAVALSEFSRKGYHGTSMTDIAVSIGATKPVLYQHFDSKRALYLELLDALGFHLISTIQEATRDIDDGRSQTERGMISFFQWVVSNEEAFNFLFAGSALIDEESADAVLKIEQAVADAITPMIAVDIPVDARRTIAFGIIGMAEGISRQLLSQGARIEAEQLGAQVAGLAWAGLRSLGQSRSTQPR